MNPGDRDYFMLRCRQERAAVGNSLGAARGRHEELAWLYEMRVIYIDRGLVPDDAEEAQDATPVQQILTPPQQ